MKLLVALQQWARAIKRDIIALWLGTRDPRVPLLAKLAGGFVAAYALSPIDLIPDFIPILGYLDDMILVPLGIMAVVRMIPREVIADLRQQAALVAERPSSRIAAVIIVTIWVSALLALAVWAFRRIAV
jgi:uncharacterized membrane protein YkvA (DUF1232 family)